ncbi:hypothetical protein ACH4RA_02330 [Streptomyces smyrnaeus]|nr:MULTISPECIES: hypothetical protein [unclassified Streptomyces]
MTPGSPHEGAVWMGRADRTRRRQLRAGRRGRGDDGSSGAVAR